ncbi:MAG: metallophosphoesterase family protein [Candidatus Heimdallarchaeaceae archaeon]
MKFAFLADIHLSRYATDKIEDVSNLPERLHSIMCCLESVAMYCLAEGIDHVVIGGDVFHGKSVIYSLAQNLFLKYIKKYTDKDLNFIIIDGNHDLSGKGKDIVSSLYTLQNLRNVLWVENGKTVFDGDNDILFVPYSHDVSEVVKQGKAKILFSHFGLNEAELSSGLSIISDLSIRDLRERYELVILGHYHKPQEIIEPNFSLYYSGSLIQLDWGEKNEQKRFLIVDSDTLDVQSIELHDYLKHVEVIMDSKNKDEAIEIASKAKEAGHHVKIIMTEKVDIDNIKGNYNIVDKTEIDITDRGITSSMTERDKCEKYLDIQEIPVKKRQMYIDKVISIIEQED